VKILRIVAVPLIISHVSNTGSVVARGMSVLITSDNLAFGTNAPGLDLDIRYDITDPPYDGEIQKRLYSDRHASLGEKDGVDEEWTVVSTFTQASLSLSPPDTCQHYLL